MRVYLGSDHAGFELKAYLIEHLRKNGHEPVDCGPAEYEPDDDYPPYCFETGRRVLADPGSLGVVIGGSGNGEQIAANKVPGIRAALAWSTGMRRPASSTVPGPGRPSTGAGRRKYADAAASPNVGYSTSPI